MSDKKLKVVIVDGNRERREKLKRFLPDYAEVFVSDFGNSALSTIKIDAKGNIPDLVIIDADDDKGLGLYTFDWMRNKEPSLSGVYIPVIALVEDEFSDRAMDFLEIDDVFFYEGEPDENSLFSVFVEAIESKRETEVKEEEPVFTEKSTEKIMGTKVSAPAGSEDKPMRCAVLDKETRMANLKAAIERGRQKTEEIRVLLAEQRGEKYVRKYTAPPVDNKADAEDRAEEHDNIPAEFSYAKNNANDNNQGLDIKHGSGGIPGNSSTLYFANSNLYNLSEFGKSILSNHNVGLKDGSAADFYKAYQNSAPVKPQPEKKKSDKQATIVIVDDDPSVRKMFELFLGSSYRIVSFDTGMKAIDYFVRNEADVLFLDAVMPGLSGLQLLNSIRWQNFGRSLPTVFLCGSDFVGDPRSLRVNHVYGVLPKPLSRGTLLTAIEQLKPYVGTL